MLRLVLPPAAIALAAIALATIALATITLPTVALVVLDALVRDIRAVHALREIAVVVHVDVHVAAAPVAVAPDCSARGHAEAEGEQGGACHVARGIVGVGRVGGIRRCVVHYGGIVG